MCIRDRYGLVPPGNDYQVSFDWDDSIVVDAEAEQMCIRDRSHPAWLLFLLYRKDRRRRSFELKMPAGRRGDRFKFCVNVKN